MANHREDVAGETNLHVFRILRVLIACPPIMPLQCDYLKRVRLASLNLDLIGPALSHRVDASSQNSPSVKVQVSSPS
jgi:hypothetical protein